METIKVNGLEYEKNYNPENKCDFDLADCFSKVGQCSGCAAYSQEGFFIYKLKTKNMKKQFSEMEFKKGQMFKTKDGIGKIISVEFIDRKICVVTEKNLNGRWYDYSDCELVEDMTAEEYVKRNYIELQTLRSDIYSNLIKLTEDYHEFKKHLNK